MSHGSMAMTLKQMPILPIGIRLSFHIQRRRGKVGETPGPCWRFYIYIYHEGGVH